MTLLWSVEIVFAKRLLVVVSAPLLAAARMGLGFARDPVHHSGHYTHGAMSA